MNNKTLSQSLGLLHSFLVITSFGKIARAESSDPDVQPTKVLEYGRLLCGCLEEDPGGFVHAYSAKSKDEVGDALFSTNCRGIRGQVVRTVYRAAQQACEGEAWSPKKSPGCYLSAAQLLNDQVLLDEVHKCKTLPVSKQQDCYNDAFFLRDVKIQEGQSVQTKPMSAEATEVAVSDRCKLISIKSKAMCPAGSKSTGFNDVYKLCTKAESSGSSSSGTATAK